VEPESRSICGNFFDRRMIEMFILTFRGFGIYKHF
jgi:hypothetical protein